MRRKRRNHKPAFKAKVALAALKGDRTLSELSEQYDVHQNQIQDWRKRLLENADSVFGQGEQQQEEAAGTLWYGRRDCDCGAPVSPQYAGDADG